MSFPRYQSYKQSDVEWLGDVPQHWTIMPIRKAAKLESGHTPSRSHPEYWKDCTKPWFTLGDVWQIRDERIDYVYETKELVNELGLANSSARLLPKGTVMLSRTASVGYSGIMGVEMATTQDFANWICGPRLDPEYLLAVFRSMKGEFTRLMMGSTHNTIYMPDIQSLTFALPPLNEQRAIVAFARQQCAQIDALIEEQQRLIDLLREKRQAVIAQAVTNGLDPATPMKDFILAPDQCLPVHWEEKRLSTACAFRSGKAHEPFFNEDGRYVCVTARFVSTDGHSRKYCSHNLTPAGKDDILMVMSDLPNGRALARAFLVEDENIYAVNQRVCVISVLSGNPRFFAYQLNRNRQLLCYDDGVSQTHLPNGAFTKLLLRVPPLSEQDAIVNFLDRETIKIDTLSTEAEFATALLQERRAALISAAVTGKIDVRGLIEANASIPDGVAA